MTGATYWAARALLPAVAGRRIVSRVGTEAVSPPDTGTGSEQPTGVVDPGPEVAGGGGSIGVVATGVVVECGDDGRIVAVRTGVERPPAGAIRLGGGDGLLLPGLVDTHSHAFHRALRGRSEGGDFWAWRAGMYRLVERLDPDSLLALATASFGELLLAGITTVHEFHYLHQPAGMDDAVCEAARRAGIRLVLLDTCYLRSGFDAAPLDPVQRRFSDGDVDAWAARADRVAAANPDVTVAAAVHSVRAVDPPTMEEVAVWARGRAVPLHLHLSEQPAENDACLAATGRTPTRLAHDHGLLGPGTTAVHCTHASEDDVALLGATATTACLCPTTERDLADGVGPAAALVAAGCGLRLGTDSHAVVDLFEEARAVELDERLVTGRRGHHAPDALLAATTGGTTLAPGEWADLCAFRLDGARLAGVDPDDPVPMVVAAATAADIADVVVGGRHVVRDGAHASLDVASALRSAIASLDDPCGPSR
jgi:formiminoglutamate deiminase